MQSRRANKNAPRKPRPLLKKLVVSVAVLALLGSAAAVAGVLYLQSQGISPRALAPYIEKRSAGHNPLIVGAGQWVARLLVGQDRPAAGLPAMLPAGLGAQESALSSVPAGAVSISVASADEVRRALAAAGPGKVITLLPGTYRFEGAALELRNGGAPNAPAILRAERPGSVIIEMNLTEGFQVSSPHWIFENLVIRGACSTAANCEHGFHVTGQGHHFSSLNNTVSDFNAHFKINGSGGQFPDNGRIIGNTINNTAPRKTSHPVTPIDLVAASGWLIAQNLIADFIKAEGDRISYGGFAKGAGTDNRFSRNAVLCEQRLQGHPGQRVGLSLGGGGTGKSYCRDQRCIVEQERSAIEGNLVASCSDAGIYLNNAAGSRVAHNSVIDTAGVQLRFPATSAMVEGNLIDGAVAAHNDAVARLEDNLDTSIAMTYAGRHPLRERYRAPQELDFSWKGEAPRRATAVVPGRDLCGNERPAARPAYGAIEDFSACLKPRQAEQMLPPPRPRRPSP